jgi:hypothetical protein
MTLEQTLSDIIIDLKALDKRLFEIQSRFEPATNDTISTLQQSIETELTQCSFMIMSLRKEKNRSLRESSFIVSILRTFTTTNELNHMIDSMFGTNRYENSNLYIVEAFALIENLTNKFFKIKEDIFQERAKFITNFTDLIYN